MVGHHLGLEASPDRYVGTEVVLEPLNRQVGDVVEAVVGDQPGNIFAIADRASNCRFAATSELRGRRARSNQCVSSTRSMGSTLSQTVTTTGPSPPIVQRNVDSVSPTKRVPKANIVQSSDGLEAIQPDLVSRVVDMLTKQISAGSISGRSANVSVITEGGRSSPPPVQRRIHEGSRNGG